MKIESDVDTRLVDDRAAYCVDERAEIRVIMKCSQNAIRATRLCTKTEKQNNQNWVRDFKGCSTAVHNVHLSPWVLITEFKTRLILMSTGDGHRNIASSGHVFETGETFTNSLRATLDLQKAIVDMIFRQTEQLLVNDGVVDPETQLSQKKVSRDGDLDGLAKCSRHQNSVGASSKKSQSCFNKGGIST